MEFNLAWALYESLKLEIQRLEANNYGQYTLTVVIENDITGLSLNCGIRIDAIQNDPSQNPVTISINCYGQIEKMQIEI
jgi:hypothetical protein